jgi:hypothetical protein
VAGKPGDVMHALTAGPGGQLIAVGESTTDGAPRAWKYTNNTWTAPVGPGSGTARRGAMNGIAAKANPTGFVAVGWTADRANQNPVNDDRTAAIWISPNGTDWTLLNVSALKVGELFDVATLPDGTFLASGVTWTVDVRDGDGVLLRSTDGSNWTVLPTTGLDGPGPTTLRRLQPTPGGGAVALGARLDGSIIKPGTWSSRDLRAWTESALLAVPAGTTPSATGLTRLPDGTLLAGGTSSTGRTDAPIVWAGRTPTTLQPRTVPGGAGAIDAVLGGAGFRMAVGSQPSKQGEVPAAWMITVN